LPQWHAYADTYCDTHCNSKKYSYTEATPDTEATPYTSWRYCNTYC
jgi:hypothetical protein